MFSFSSRKKQTAAIEDTIERHGKWAEVWKRLKKNKVAMASLVLLVIILLSTIFANVLAPYSFSEVNIANRFQYPSAEHLLGTDNYGRDILTRIMYGGRISLLVSLLAIAMSTVVGGFLGATAAYFGGRYENIVMRCLDVLMAIPAFLLAISISAALGSGVFNSAIALSVAGIPSSARLMRATVLGVKDQEYVEAARANGVRTGGIILRHIIPNCFAPVLVDCTLRIGSNILQISSLSFIGLGVQPPTPEWGSILAAGRDYIRDFWPIVVFPGIAIMLTLIAFNLLGDGLRDAMDPRLKR